MIRRIHIQRYKSLRDADVTLAALQAGHRSLEEVFLQITAEEAR